VPRRDLAAAIPEAARTAAVAGAAADEDAQTASVRRWSAPNLCWGPHNPLGTGGRAALDGMQRRRRVVAPAPAAGGGGDTPAAGAREQGG